MSIDLTILGCGSSGGVPRLGQGWGACDPANPKNRRTRCSILLRRTGPDGKQTVVLVDTSPDMREQLLRTGIDRLDGIVLTHSHADHTHGIDDVRPLVLHMKSRIGIHMDAATSAVVRQNFSYIFETPSGSMYPPLLDEYPVVPGEFVTIDGPGGAIRILPFLLEHGEINALGLRIGNVAYTPDVSMIPERAVPYLRGLETWIIDALRYTPHPSHFSLAEARAWIDRMTPDSAILTNLHTDLDYGRLDSETPCHIMPAYDGLRLDVFGVDVSA